MTTVRDAYDPKRVEQIRKVIEMQLGKNFPIQFEIQIDSLTVVPRTRDINEFDTYDEFIGNGAKNMRILIYNSTSQPDQITEYLFKLGSYMSQFLPAPVNNSLDGLELEKQINEQVNTKIAEMEFKRELKETKEQLKDAETTIDSLTNELEQERAKKGVEMKRWGEVGSLVLEGIIKRNPQILSVLPGGENLAGIFMEQPEIPKDAGAPQPQATFREKGEPEQKFSPKEQAFHALFNELERAFAHDHPGLIKVNFLFGELIKNPSLVHDIEALIKEPGDQSDNETATSDNI